MSGKVRIRLGDLLLKTSFNESQGLIKVCFQKRPPLGTQPPPACCACYWDSYYRTWCVEGPSMTRCCRSPCRLWSSSLDPAALHLLSATFPARLVYRGSWAPGHRTERFGLRGVHSSLPVLSCPFLEFSPLLVMLGNS